MTKTTKKTKTSLGPARVAEEFFVVMVTKDPTKLVTEADLQNQAFLEQHGVHPLYEKTNGTELEAKLDQWVASKIKKDHEIEFNYLERCIPDGIELINDKLCFDIAIYQNGKISKEDKAEFLEFVQRLLPNFSVVECQSVQTIHRSKTTKTFPG